MGVGSLNETLASWRFKGSRGEIKVRDRIFRTIFSKGYVVYVSRSETSDFGISAYPDHLTVKF